MLLKHMLSMVCNWSLKITLYIVGWQLKYLWIAKKVRYNHYGGLCMILLIYWGVPRIKVAPLIRNFINFCKLRIWSIWNSSTGARPMRRTCIWKLLYRYSAILNLSVWISCSTRQVWAANVLYISRLFQNNNGFASVLLNRYLDIS